MSDNYLLTPGPTPVPSEVLEAMARPIIHHRTPQFQAILKEVEEDLKNNGFDVIVFVPSIEEDNSKITCGNAILAEME